MNDVVNIQYNVLEFNSINDTTCKLHTYTAEAILDKLKIPHRVKPTVAEVQEMKKELKNKYKAEAGGYLAATSGGNRKTKESIESRTFLVIDIDWPESGFVEKVKSLGYSGFLHPTFSSTPGAPKFRWGVFPNRYLSVNECEPVVRALARKLGMPQVDPVSFRIQQVSYNPCVPSDAEYILEAMPGETLDVDAFLAAEYINYLDFSEWPMHPNENKIIRNGCRKQSDPLKKSGLIGAFCRRYTMTEVLEKFLSGVYEPCDIENRWTFIGGSTYGGLIVYDDKFAYSHHGTDPACGKLCNAFDLVRIHLFADLDEK